MPDELWNKVCDTVQETGMKTIPMEKKGKGRVEKRKEEKAKESRKER